MDNKVLRKLEDCGYFSQWRDTVSVEQNRREENKGGKRLSGET